MGAARQTAFLEFLTRADNRARQGGRPPGLIRGGKKKGSRTYDGYVPTDHHQSQDRYRQPDGFLGMEDAPVKGQDGELGHRNRGGIAHRSRDVRFQEERELEQRDGLKMSAEAVFHD